MALSAVEFITDVGKLCFACSGVAALALVPFASRGAADEASGLVVQLYEEGWGPNGKHEAHLIARSEPSRRKSS